MSCALRLASQSACDLSCFIPVFPRPPVFLHGIHFPFRATGLRHRVPPDSGACNAASCPDPGVRPVPGLLLPACTMTVTRKCAWRSVNPNAATACMRSVVSRSMFQFSGGGGRVIQAPQQSADRRGRHGCHRLDRCDTPRTRNVPRPMNGRRRNARSPLRCPRSARPRRCPRTRSAGLGNAPARRSTGGCDPSLILQSHRHRDPAVHHCRIGHDFRSWRNRWYSRFSSRSSCTRKTRASRSRRRSAARR